MQSGTSLPRIIPAFITGDGTIVSCPANICLTAYSATYSLDCGGTVKSTRALSMNSVLTGPGQSMETETWLRAARSSS